MINGLDRNPLRNSIAAQPLIEFWPRAIEFYKDTGCFRESAINFRDLPSPFAGRLNCEQHDQLFDAVIENGQNWDASETDVFLLGMLCNATPAERTAHEARNRFFLYVRRMNRLDKYEDVLAFFQANGWVIPPPQQDEE